MQIKDAQADPNSFEVVGIYGERYTLETPATYGVATYGVTTYGNLYYNPGYLDFGIYQRRKIYGKNFNVKYDFYDYVITHTAAQQTRREKFAAAVLAWQNLTSEQKAVYNQRARPLQMFGNNLFIREFMLS